MKEFFTSYKWLFLIGTFLILFSIALSWAAYPSHLLRERHLDETMEGLNHAYAANASESKKREIVIKGQDSEELRSIGSEIVSHLAEALFLAGVMIWTAEAVTKFIAVRDERKHMEKVVGDAEARATAQAKDFDRRYTELSQNFDTRYTTLSTDFDRRIHNISSNVWQAMVNKMVPDKIGTEILAILKSDVCRFRPIYAVTLLREPFSDLQDDEIVVRRELSYEISNLTGSTLTYPLRIQVLSHTGGRTLGNNGQRLSLPRICEVKVDGLTVPLNGAHSFEKTVALNANPNVVTKIQSVVEEIAKINDRALYVLREPCVGVELHVDNQVPHLVKLLEDQVYLTSGATRLTRNIGMVWSYEHAVLSGTALSVAWEPKRKALPAAVGVAAETVAEASDFDDVGIA